MKKQLLLALFILLSIFSKAQSNGVLYKLPTPLKDLVRTYSYMSWSCDNYPSTTIVVEWTLPNDTSKVVYSYGGKIVIPDSIVKLQPIDKKNTAIPNWIFYQQPWKKQD